MDFQYSDKVESLRKQLTAFMEEHIYLNEALYQQQKEENRERGHAYAKVPIVDELKERHGPRACGTFSCRKKNTALA